jgi:hypothetical protein
MKDSFVLRTPSDGPRPRPGAPAAPGRVSAGAPDAHAMQRARVVASLVLHPHPKDKRHAPGR